MKKFDKIYVALLVESPGQTAMSMLFENSV